MFLSSIADCLGKWLTFPGSGWSAMIIAFTKVSVACLTENQGFTASGGHRLNPPCFLAAFVFVEVFERTEMVGSGADAPVQGSSVTRPQNRACTFQCTRLALYVFLEMLFVRECACMKLVMAATAKNECLPVTSRHHTLPERLSFCYIFQFSHVMHLKRPFRRFTVLALLPVEPFDDFREAQCPEVPVELDIELSVVRYRFSEVFESKDTDVTGLLLSFDSELETILRLDPFDNLVHARFVLVRQGFQKTRLPDPF